MTARANAAAATAPAPDRAGIERLLQSATTPIPPALRAAYGRYQLAQSRRFLLLINLLGQAAYFSYGLADALVVPDVLHASLLVRGGFMVLTLPGVLWLFRHSRNIRLLDMLLPLLVLLATIAWFVLLSHSQSPALSRYQYASVIFIVLANLGVRAYYLPSLAISLLISAAILVGVHRLNPGDNDELLVFALVYLPVLLFSQFISWSTTLAGRRAFLRAVLDDETHQALGHANARFQRLADTDALTGIANRRQFDAQAQRFWDDWQRDGRPFALVLADVDHFKSYNDHYGHPAGDACLVQVAEALDASMREGEHVVARHGGEEFAILVAAARPEALPAIAERLVQAVQSLAIAHAHRPDGLAVVTLSLGGLVVSPSVASLDALTRQADALLYRAKNGGRGRACIG